MYIGVNGMRIDRSKETLGDVTGLNEIFRNIHAGTRSIRSSYSINFNSYPPDKLMNDLLDRIQHEISEEIDRAILDKMVNSVTGTGKIKRYKKVLHV